MSFWRRTPAKKGEGEAAAARRRLTELAALLRAVPGATVVLSEAEEGGAPGVLAAREFLAALGVDPSRIQVEVASEPGS